MQINFGNMFGPKSWASANEHWIHTKQSRSRFWEADERPLRDTRSHHMRLVRNKDESYDCVFYRHTMIRYFKPDANGDYVVDLFMPWRGNSNYQYLDTCGWNHGSRLAAVRRRKRVWLPIYPSSENDSQTAHLVFDTRNRLRCDQSWHLQSYRWRYSSERKEWRVAVADRLQDIINLLFMAQDGIKPEYDPDLKVLFKQKTWWRHQEDKSPRGQMRDTGTVDELQQFVTGSKESYSERAMQGLMDWFQRVLDVRFTKDQNDWQMGREQIASYTMRLLEDKNPRSGDGCKVPNKMWANGKRRPPRTQYFHTRAEAARASAEALDFAA